MFRCLVTDDDLNCLDRVFCLTIGLRMEGSTVVLFRAYSGKEISLEGAYEAIVVVGHKGDRNTLIMSLKVANGCFALLLCGPV